MDTHDFYWLVGLYEGEGHCRISRGRAQLTIKMCDLDVLERAREIANVGNINGPYRVNMPNRKPIYAWTVYRNNDARRLLAQMLPLLGKRRKEQVRDVLYNTQDISGTRHGEPLRGESHPSAKLDNDVVRRIRQLTSEGVSARAMAKELSVTPECINNVIKRRTWAHVSQIKGLFE